MSRKPMVRALPARAAAVAALFAVLVAQFVFASPSGAAIEPPEFPEPAYGDVNLVFSGPGTPARYGANQIVRVDIGNINFIKGCIPGPSGEAFPDFIQPSADLYVVDAGRTFTNKTRLVDNAGAPTTVFGVGGGAFFDAKLALTGPQGRAGSGVYDVVVDECQNGMFDTGQDTVIRNAFRVDVDNVVPGFSTEAAEWFALKEDAGARAGDVTQIERLYVDITMAEVYNKVNGTLSAFTSPSSFGMFALGYFIDKADPFAKAREQGKNIMRVSAGKRRAALRHLAADPPDPDFQRFVAPVRTAPSISADIAELDDVYASASIMDALGAVEEAFLAAVERYQGAQQAGNAVWAARHARSLDELATLHDELSAGFVAAMDPVADRYRNYPAGPAMRNGIHQTIAKWSSPRGYRTDHDWWNAGAGAEQTERALTEWRRLMVTPNSPGEIQGADGYAEQARAAAARTRDLSASMRTWADSALPPLLTELDVLNGDREDPVVAIDPVTGATAGGDVALSVDVPGTGSPDAVAWDLDGDGVFDDALGENPTWTVPGDAAVGSLWVIGAEVQAAGGIDTAFTTVSITEGNRRPVVDAVDAGPVAADPGDTVTFEATASDPDGDDVTVEWLVEDEIIQTGGTSLDVDVPADFYGQTNVTMIATDEHGATAMGMWLIQVHSGVDADRDGYEAFPGPDCDDDNWSVHPGRDEVVGNGIDDDCDPSTPDTPGNPGSSAGSLGSSYFNGVEGDLHEMKITNWAHVDRYGDVPFRLDVTWADGVTTSQTVQGTTYADTFFTPRHQYGSTVVAGDIDWCIYDPDDTLVGCNGYENRVNVVNKGPFVNPADFRTWKSDNQGVVNPELCEKFRCDASATWVPNDPDGRAFSSIGNPSEATVGYSPVELSEGGYGRAMVELSVPETVGDDDLMGLVLGYQAGEVGGVRGTDDDFISFDWFSGGDGGTSCRGTLPPGVHPAKIATWSRTRGPVHPDERWYHTKLDLPDDGSGRQHAWCHDEYGVELLTEIDWPDGAVESGRYGGWLKWAMSDAAVAGPTRGPVAHPYRFTVDYRADRIRMWTANGTLVTDLTPPDPDDPFPPGALGAIYQSQSGVRVTATAPEPEFDFTQGTSGTVTMPFTDGGIGETYSVHIDWGDGTSATAGTYTADPATGHGWWTAAGEHVYQRAGSYRGTVCVDDDEGDGTCFTFRAEVENLAPVVDAGPDFVGDGTVSLDQATFTDPGALDDHTATIDWGDGTVEPGTVVENRSTGGLVQGTHDYTTDGIYEVEVCVTDQGGLTDCDTLRVDTRVTNVAPTALIELPDPAVVNQQALIGGGFTDPNPNDTHTITIDPGDGSGPTEVAGQFMGTFGSAGLGVVYTRPGSYRVTVCVTDSEDEQDCITDTLVVTDDGSNKTPVADPGGPYTVEEGSTVTLDGSASTDPDGDVVSFAWDLDGGSDFDVPGAVVDFTGVDGPASETVALQVCDPDLACDVATVAVEVTNADPVVEAGRDRTSGLTLTLDDSTFTDPGLADTHTATVDWGDGAGPQEATVTGDAAAGSVQANHTYADLGPRTVTVCVTDDDGGRGCDDFDVVIEASPIVVTAGPDIDIDEGGTARIDFTFTDDDGGPHSATVRWADGSDPSVVPLTDAGTTGSGTASHVFVDEGDYGVTVEVCDATGCGSVAVTVRVANVAPTVEAPTGTVEGSSLDLEAVFTDPGVDDTHTATIDWGDGTTTEGTVTDGLVTGTHRYAAAGTRTVEVCVTDDSGATGCASADLTVDDPINDPPVIVLDPPGTASEGTRFLLRGTFTDADTADAWTLTIDWGDGTEPSVSTPSAPGDFEAAHVYADDGVHTITVTVDDGTDRASAQVVDLDVVNLAPVVAFTGTDDGLDVTLDIQVSDPGILDVLAATIDWGDGTIEPATRADSADPNRFTGAHSYAAAGSYDIEVCGTDGDGGESCRNQTIVLTAAEPPTTPPGTTVTDPGPDAPPTDPGPDTPTTVPPPSDAPNPNVTPQETGGTGPTRGTEEAGSLPRTGFDSGLPLRGGLLLLLLGAVLALASRLRRPARWFN